MEELKSLNLEIKFKGLDNFKEKLDELNSKLYMLGYNYERMKNILKSSERLIEEINKMDLVVDIDRDLKGGLYGEGN